MIDKVMELIFGTAFVLVAMYFVYLLIQLFLHDFFGCSI